MTEQAEPLKAKPEITGIELSFNIRYQKPEDVDSPESFFRDNVFVNFRDEQSLNRIVADKPYLAEIIPVLVSEFIKEIDTANTAGTELKNKVLEILTA